MSSSDHDEPRGSRRRRGRGGREGGFDDFWTRDNGGTPGKTRRRAGDAGTAPAGFDPADVSDLSGEHEVIPDRPRRPPAGPAGPAPMPPRDTSARGRATRPGVPSGPRPAPAPARDVAATGRPAPGPGPRTGRGGRGRPGGDPVVADPGGFSPPLGPPPRAAAPPPRRAPAGGPPSGRGVGRGALRSPTSGEVIMPVGHPLDAPPTGPSARTGPSGPRRAPAPAEPRMPPTRGPSYPDRTRQARGGVPGPRAAGPGMGPAGAWSAGNVAWDEQPMDQIAMRVPEPAGYPATAEVPSYATPPGRGERWDDGGTGAGSFPDPDHPGGHPDDAYGDDSYYDDYDEGDGGGDDLPKRRGCRNALIVLTVLVVIAGALGWYGWSWVQERIDPPGPQGDEVLVDVPEGTSTAGVGDILAEAGVISDATVWDWYTKLRDVGTIQAGSYLMRVDSSFTEAIDALAAEPLPPDSRLVTVPEGLTQAQIAARLADPEDGVPGFTVQGMRAALADPASRSPLIPAQQTLLEGVLFPETYTVEEGDTELIVVRRMVDQFQEVATEVDLEARAAAMGKTPYEILIVASMIEREAGIPADGPRVARVVYNRLDQDIPLGIDATSCYELGGTPCDLTTEILNDNTPYDTRAQLGLPPTPIASPGQAAIEAALSPAEGDWIYYILDVTKDDGSSLFTSSAADFEDAKERCVAAGRCG